MDQSDGQTVYYKPVPGSRDLETVAAGAAEDLEIIENSDHTGKLEIEFGGETLHSGLGPSEFPKDLYDHVLPILDPLEQAFLGQLYRLSYGEGSDWVRLSKSELKNRTGCSDRRVLKVLSGLVEKGLIRPIHRDNRGTLYKISTIEQMKITLNIQGVTCKAKKNAHKEKVPTPRAKTLESPLNEEAFPHDGKVITMREIATEFFHKIGKKPSDVDMDSALAQITYLLEDGFTREEVRDAVDFLAKTFGKQADIFKLPYYIHNVIDRKD